MKYNNILETIGQTPHLRINKLFSSNLDDILSGYRTFNKLFVKSFPVVCEGFEIETHLTLHALSKRFKVVELPIKYQDRPVWEYIQT